MARHTSGASALMITLHPVSNVIVRNVVRTQPAFDGQTMFRKCLRSSRFRVPNGRMIGGFN
jgi:hypothetical protein